MKRCLVLLLLAGGMFGQTALGVDKGIILSGTNVVGDLSSFVKSQEWTFSGNAGDRVLVYSGRAPTSPNSLVLNVLLYAGPTSLVAQAVSVNGVLDHGLPSNGQYTVAFRAAAGVGRYGASFVNLAGSLTSTGDPDGGAITLSQVVTGKLINVSHDMDVYQFTGTAGEWVSVQPTVTAGPIAILGRLYPPGGGPMEAEGIGSYVNQLAASGLYSLVVSATTTNVGGYSLLLETATNVDPDGFWILPGQTLLDTALHTAEDVDSLYFYGDAGDRVRISVAASFGSLSPIVSLHSPGDSNTLATVTGPLLDTRLQVSGIHTATVASAAYTGNTAFHATLIKLPGVTSTPDDPDGALMLAGQTIVSNRIQFVSDQDVFQFYGQQGDRIQFGAEATSSGLTNRVDLYPPRGGSAAISGTEWILNHVLSTSGLYSVTVSDSTFNHTGVYDVTFLSSPFVKRPGVYRMQPEQWQTNLQSTVSLSWDEVAGATGYDVFFGTNLTQALPVVAPNHADTALDLGRLVIGPTYYWHVTPLGVPLVTESPRRWFMTDLVHTQSVVMINELLVDAVGNDATGRLEFVEILHYDN